MKKTIIILIITIITIIVVLSSIVVAKTRKNGEATIEEKVIQELNYLNKYCVSLLTSLNGIVVENEVIKEDTLQTQFGSDTNNGIQTSRSIMNNNQQNSKSNNSNDSQDTTNNKDGNSILANDGDYSPDWESIQLQVERLYQMWNVISLDLHSMNIDSNLILSFSDVLNNVTQNVKRKDKANTVEELVKLYKLVIQYTNICKPSSQETTISTIKYNIVSSYANITNDKWEQAEAQIAEAQNLFTNLLNSVNNNYNQQYNMNRCYILVNELKKAIKLRDKEIFYLQYKTLITQLYFFID